MIKLSSSLAILTPILISLFLNGCDSHDQQSKTLTDQSANKIAVDLPSRVRFQGFSLLNDSITIKGSADSISIRVLDLIDIIGSQSKYMFVLQPARLKRVVTTVGTGRIPLKDLLQKIETATKSKVVLSEKNLIITPKDTSELF